MSDDELSPAQLEQLLMAMCAHQTDTIKAAEEIITAFLQKSACVAALMIQITQSQRVEARQLAAIYLRKKIGLHWKKLKANVKDQIKAALLQRYACDCVVLSIFCI
jgi:mRNA degradation ribonuclease J1/J2